MNIFNRSLADVGITKAEIVQSIRTCLTLTQVQTRSAQYSYQGNGGITREKTHRTFKNER